MNIKYVREMSDLHGEFGPFTPPPLDTDHETVLMLSGDVHVKARAILSGWMKEVSSRFAYVLYVLGNHEHWTYSIDRTANKIREVIAQQEITNVIVLENQTFEIPGTNWKVFGGTMWTDFNRGNPVTEWEAERTMKDYSKIRIHNHEHRLKPRHLIVEHLKFKAALEAELKIDDGFNVIAMSHHAPHQLSIDPKYANDYHGNGAYASDLSNLILDNPKIKYWFHGHMHNNSDYMIGDDCRVICNPYGYTGFELNSAFNPTLRLEL